MVVLNYALIVQIRTYYKKGVDEKEVEFLYNTEREGNTNLFSSRPLLPKT